MENKTTKIILIVLGVLVLCCCLVGVGGFFMVNNFMSEFSSGDIFVDDPAQISQITGEMDAYQLPSGFEEEYVMDFFNVVQGVFMTSESKGAIIMMVQLSDSLFGSLEGYSEQFQESFLQQYQLDDINLNQVGERMVEIRGQQVPVQVSEGSDNEGYNYVQWVATFEGENGTVLVIMLGNSAAWDDAEMESFLTSIE